jgi:hypothetical protein
MSRPLGIIDVQIIGDDAGVQAMLKKLDTSLSAEALGMFFGETIEPYFRERVLNRFASEGDDVVGKWTPLTNATKAIRVQMGYGEGPINKRTGQLEEYIARSNYGVTITAAGSVLTMPAGKPSGELLKKVQTAQQGKDNPRTPPRPVLGMNEKDLAFTLEALAMYLQRAQV